MLFRLQNVGKEFNGRRLFESVAAQVNEGERIGLIGRNGTGKTTLLDIISGRQRADQGDVFRQKGLEITQQEQVPRLLPATSLKKAALEVFEDLRRGERRLRFLEHEMSVSRRGIPPELAAEYETLQARFRLFGGYDYEARTESVLRGVGFQAEDFEMPCERLSGGQVRRLLLARTVLAPSQLLLLDEPTNHLDLTGILYLADFLAASGSALIVVSHDRHFLDRTTSLTWELEGGGLETYSGSFSASRKLREQRLEQRRKEYLADREWRAKTEDFIRRNLAGQKTKQAQARRKRLAKAEAVKPPVKDEESLLLEVREAQRGGTVSFRFEQASIGYPGVALLEGVELQVLRGERIGILGGNGSGKSTFLKTLMGQLPPLSGRLQRGLNTVFSYFSQKIELGDPERTVLECLRELDSLCPDEELRSLAARFLFRQDDVFKKVGRLSGGEQSRLALARLLFHPTNVLLLDEPTNHLDIASRQALESALADYSGTLIIVSHDLYFLEQTVERYLAIRETKLVEVSDPGEAGPQDKRKTGSQPDNDPQASTNSEPDSQLLNRPQPRAADASPTAAPLSKNERMRLEKRLAGMEAEIESLESIKQDLLKSLQTEEDFARRHELAEKYERTSQSLKEHYQSWEELAAKLPE